MSFLLTSLNYDSHICEFSLSSLSLLTSSLYLLSCLNKQVKIIFSKLSKPSPHQLFYIFFEQESVAIKITLH